MASDAVISGMRWYDHPVPPVNFRFGQGPKHARAPTSVNAEWNDNFQQLFSKDNKRMTTNLRSYFDRNRPLNDVTGLTERPPLQITWSLGAGGPKRQPPPSSTLGSLGASASAPDMGSTSKSRGRSMRSTGKLALKDRPSWNGSCFFDLGSENNEIQHDAQRVYFYRTAELGNVNKMADRIYPSRDQDTVAYRGRLRWSSGPT